MADRPTANWPARWTVVLGVLTIAVGPAAIIVSRKTSYVTLIEATGAIAASGLLGIWTMLLARRARETDARTLGRVGGIGIARVGRVLGGLGVFIGVAASISLGFYYLLTVFLD